MGGLPRRLLTCEIQPTLYKSSILRANNDNNTQIFSDYIAFNLKKNKNHKKFLRQIILIIEKFWKIRKISLRGIQLRVTGKIDGRMRKSKYHYSIGKVQLQSLQTNLNYSISLSYTKFGVISIKF